MKIGSTESDYMSWGSFPQIEKYSEIWKLSFENDLGSSLSLMVRGKGIGRQTGIRTYSGVRSQEKVYA
ncbi:MAG: hypothetical protein LUQ33_05380 [Methanoregulaceae archaeon]|nr:hypothetical protein [Methanoregulaceae archaeon]